MRIRSLYVDIVPVIVSHIFQKGVMSELSDIIANYSEELKRIDLNGVLYDLRRGNILNQKEYLEIVKTGSEEKLQFLQSHLPWKGYIAFMTFVDILRKRGHENLAHKLQGKCYT